MTQALLLSVFVIATCGLVYELLAGTIASYLLGDSVTQFSTIIGVYLFAMGVGSYLSRFVHRQLVARFVQIEILVGLVGGLSALVLYFAFTELASFRVVLYGWVLLTGTLVGMEIPLLLRILKDRLHFRELVAQVLSLDYLGALVASLLFPLWLVPRIGLMRSSFLFGLLNVLVAAWACHLFRDALGRRRFLAAQAWSAAALLAVGVAFADELADATERRLYDDTVIYSRSSPYQRITLTRSGDELRLYLNGHLQFSSFDEYRYHEALVHPGLASLDRPRRVLVLGGGDGLAVREILRYPTVERIVLVDLDPAMTRLFRDRDELAALNGRALRDPRVTIVNADAFVWLEEDAGRYDFVAVDFPDPSSYSLAKLYTTTFYRLLAARLAPGGVAAVQSTSPLFARPAFWCIVATIREAGLRPVPYHAYVPSFGEWGFVLAAREEPRPARDLPEGLRFLSAALLPALFEFPADMAPVAVEPNRLNDQLLVRYYERAWSRFAD